MAKLFLKFDSAIIKEVLLKKDVTTFGRKPGNDIVIDHPTISGFHGKICKEGDKFMVYDLNSTNGTFVNGHRIQTSGEVKHKDQIGVSRHILEMVSDDAIAPGIPVSIDTDGSQPGQPTVKAEELPPNLQGASKALLKDGGGANAMGQDVYGVIKIISGAEGPAEIRLKEIVTYIGTSDTAAIKIKGLLAPSLAAAISRRPEGYFLKAVKPGYPKVNGNPVKEQVFLESGALIEAGGTNMVFYRSDSKKEKEKEKPEQAAS